MAILEKTQFAKLRIHFWPDLWLFMVGLLCGLLEATSPNGKRALRWLLGFDQNQTSQHRMGDIGTDRHEIFLIIAEYGDNYINYITAGDPIKSPLLMIWQIGPFQPTAMNHIRLLGACLQAFASRLLTLAS
ncbi:predicted protein [Histoplasma capsulatum G186AR]|uniref:Uncharacterized protein n=1 Tax=Ajellomyces capsulatus (strain G186AR / H82 / ATCC MYA-2454 / RMSCC 2432) TaxID=447093 RepID=C0NMS6_AJECG|nr:uncharacterized protein HCBG_04053 [Histoplasma capsulatum G186AR]EEH07174.1 predicted protein [Histoplasma capsulatum G186AR]